MKDIKLRKFIWQDNKITGAEVEIEYTKHIVEFDKPMELGASPADVLAVALTKLAKKEELRNVIFKYACKVYEGMGKETKEQVRINVVRQGKIDTPNHFPVERVEDVEECRKAVLETKRSVDSFRSKYIPEDIGSKVESNIREVTKLFGNRLNI